MTQPRDYAAFIAAKTHLAGNHGFEPLFMPEILFPFQRALIEWACVKGRAAIFADCGLGKTMMQLTWAQNVVEKTNGRVLILTPLSVCFQTVNEGKKFGVEAVHVRNPEQPLPRIVVTNYERLHLFNPSDFEGIVCDESSILKCFDGVTRQAVTAFARQMKYRLLCTATPAPNDHIELGSSAEALGVMGAQDMINMFFKKAKSTSSASEEHRAGLFVLRPHAKASFWQWVTSWSRACRKPSDMGFDDGDFKLPPITIQSHIVTAQSARDGYLLDLPAVGLAEQRNDLSRTVKERCEAAASLCCNHVGQSIAWCNLNKEGDLLERLCDDAEQVSGSDTEDHRERVFEEFTKGNIRTLVTKSSVAGFGLNMQNCHHQTYFPSHSFESFYQSVRRCWRFGQKHPVTVDMITTAGQADVVANLDRKAREASAMFDQLVAKMWDSASAAPNRSKLTTVNLPQWI
jgi:hypothetical protein